ncbi:Tfp pilus assembly protein, ATPase PilM [Legionella adelaidensis]|uniref:Tfp pilus assembly protein, ATPase PilM n=1 Tax=Legionella adelaidensis TaxID=45056 RepID=A0A0W0R3X5_9GAMM|nr:type IV pilus assembly protein PilM [Legionella adelaidensis]KTC65782.1 Tfp pilus assembly protein, ATPase PilM [Legionella adelaidensis]
MLNLFKPKQHSILGIDISSTSIHILEVSANADIYKVEGYGSIALPENVMEGNQIKEIDTVANYIRKILLENRISTKRAALAVPDSTAISKIIQVNEGLNENEIEELVAMEADKYIPYPIDEINLDFNILGTSSKSASMLDVLIVASRSENVNNRVSAITRAGLEAHIVDVESYAVERAVKLLAADLPAQGEHKNIAIIDFGASYTHFYVFHNFKIIFSREEEFGGKQLIELMKQHYAMETKQAIDMLESGAVPADFTEVILQPFEELLLLQVKRAIQFFFSNSHHTHIDQIFLAGGIAKQPELAHLIQEHINIPTLLANPFGKTVELGAKVNRTLIFQNAPRLIVAAGLALRAC